MEEELADPAAVDTSMSRRTLLKGVGGAGALGLTASTLGALEALVITPDRAGAADATAAAAKAPAKSDIQFDIGAFIAPAVTLDGIMFQFGPVYTTFATYTLNRRPNKIDQALLANALNTIEQKYAFSPSGVFTYAAYGIPYFKKVGNATAVNAFIPKLASNNKRLVLEEAVPSPTDVSPNNPTITKAKFNVPVKIESNDMLIMVRSDVPANITDVLAYLGGATKLNGQKVPAAGLNNLMKMTSSRVMFTQQGLPRKMADANGLEFAGRINPRSPMWMGFGDQQVSGAGPAAITTFVGNASAKVTTAKAGDYFDNGSIAHLSHVIEDLEQWYEDEGDEAEPYTERVQYMFRSNPIPSVGNTDQFTDGGGGAFFENIFQGTGDALANAQAVNTFEGEHRMGHLCALQRSSRAADGTPMHIRNDGPGFDSMDVPDGSVQPKLQFLAFFPSAEFFRVMRVNDASLDLVAANGVEDEDNGLERFTTTTRRQNYLFPPRRHRAFPLVEFNIPGSG